MQQHLLMAHIIRIGTPNRKTANTMRISIIVINWAIINSFQLLDNPYFVYFFTVTLSYRGRRLHMGLHPFWAANFLENGNLIGTNSERIWGVYPMTTLF